MLSCSGSLFSIASCTKCSMNNFITWHVKSVCLHTSKKWTKRVFSVFKLTFHKPYLLIHLMVFDKKQKYLQLRMPGQIAPNYFVELLNNITVEFSTNDSSLHEWSSVTPLPLVFFLNEIDTAFWLPQGRHFPQFLMFWKLSI
jgi:hypothetical protein